MKQTSITNLESQKLETVLSAHIVELEQVLRHRDFIAVERSADQVDEVQKASVLALAVSQLDRKSLQLREARRALRRIQEGTFGICEQCEEGIPLKRLRAVPWTAFCIRCQEQMDRDRKDMRGERDSFWRREVA